MKVVNITEVMIKLQFKLPQALISRGFTQRTVFHAPAFQQKGINRLMDIYFYFKHFSYRRNFNIENLCMRK